MGNNAIDMKVDDGLLAFRADEEGAVGGVAHVELFAISDYRSKASKTSLLFSTLSLSI